MPTPIKMPQLGETVVEGTVSRWLKKPGDRVERQESLLEISTDKIDTEIPAPAAGTLLQIVVSEGTTVRVGTVIGYIGAPGEAVVSEQLSVSSEQSPVASHQSPIPNL
jgi:pyruvate/2-oxoglutarate dehydrogenase complex dihydrolipoamide acyltransferase (E2) component